MVTISSRAFKDAEMTGDNPQYLYAELGGRQYVVDPQEAFKVWTDNGRWAPDIPKKFAAAIMAEAVYRGLIPTDVVQ